MRKQTEQESSSTHEATAEENQTGTAYAPAPFASGMCQYTEMKGRTVERIEVCLSPDYHCVSIRFEDKTDFTVEMDTRMICQAFHADWKTGKHARAEVLASH